MIVRATSEQISYYWPEIRKAIEEAMPPVAYRSPEYFNNILYSLLAGDRHCWIVFRPEDEKTIQTRFLGIALTEFNIHDAAQVKNLHLFVLYFDPDIFVSDEELLDSYKTLLDFARDQNCHRIIGYTASRRIIDIVKKAGGAADYTFCSLETGILPASSPYKQPVTRVSAIRPERMIPNIPNTPDNGS